jgi:hypothetical protein
MSTCFNAPDIAVLLEDEPAKVKPEGPTDD